VILVPLPFVHKIVVMELKLPLNNAIIKMGLDVLAVKFNLGMLVSIIYTQNLYAIQFVEIRF
jgi:hypothetical protein